MRVEIKSSTSLQIIKEITLALGLEESAKPGVAVSALINAMGMEYVNRIKGGFVSTQQPVMMAPAPVVPSMASPATPLEAAYEAPAAPEPEAESASKMKNSAILASLLA